MQHSSFFIMLPYCYPRAQFLRPVATFSLVRKFLSTPTFSPVQQMLAVSNTTFHLWESVGAFFFDIPFGYSSPCPPIAKGNTYQKSPLRNAIYAALSSFGAGPSPSKRTVTVNPPQTLVAINGSESAEKRKVLFCILFSVSTSICMNALFGIKTLFSMDASLCMNALFGISTLFSMDALFLFCALFFIGNLFFISTSEVLYV